MAENLEPPAQKKKKGGFFMKPAWLQAQKKTDAPEVKRDATEIFSRSTRDVSEILAEQKRKDQLVDEKQARAVKSERVEPGGSGKRRKISEEGDYSDDDKK